MYKKNDGFTLVELIVVLAVLAIIGTIAVPKYLGIQEESKRKVCALNRQTVIDSYLMEKTFDNSVTIDSVIKNYQTKQNGKLCPKKGVVFGYAMNADKDIRVFCLEHREEHIDVYGSMIYLRASIDNDINNKMSDDDFEAKYGFRKGHKYSNDKYRDYVYKQLGNSWPTLDEKIKTAAGLKDNYYVQPYTNDKTSVNNIDVFLFASTNNNINTKNWNTDMIYNQENGKWYKRSPNAFSIADYSWSEVKTWLNGKPDPNGGIWTEVNPK